MLEHRVDFSLEFDSLLVKDLVKLLHRVHFLLRGEWLSLVVNWLAEGVVEVLRFLSLSRRKVLQCWCGHLNLLKERSGLLNHWGCLHGQLLKKLKSSFVVYLLIYWCFSLLDFLGCLDLLQDLFSFFTRGYSDVGIVKQISELFVILKGLRVLVKDGCKNRDATNKENCIE